MQRVDLVQARRVIGAFVREPRVGWRKRALVSRLRQILRHTNTETKELNARLQALTQLRELIRMELSSHANQPAKEGADGGA